MRGFLRSNPGLSRRFPLRLEFPDYSIDELALIFEKGEVVELVLG